MTTDVNTMNAVIREQARIREQVMKLSTVELEGSRMPLISRADVLKILG